MADSDDEYDRKRRDKFRGERSSGGGGGDSYRADRRGDDRGRRDDWQDRGRARPDYRDYRGGGGGGGGAGGGGRDRFSPDRGGPPVKRMRPTEWGEDGRPRYGGHDPYGVPYGAGGWGVGAHDHYPVHGAHGFGGGGGGHAPGGLHQRLGVSAGAAAAAAAAAAANDQNNPDLQTQPPMLTLKQFLATQDDSISDSDAITKYNEYKQDFRRQQLNEFFVTHKDEEWFKIKYHPEESSKRKDEQLNFLKRRASVFNALLESGVVTDVNVDTTQTENLLRLLDTVVIKLEGGTDEDLKVLNEKPPAEISVRPMDASTLNNKPTIQSVRTVSLSSSSGKTDDKKDDGVEVATSAAGDSITPPSGGNKNNPFARKPNPEDLDFEWAAKLKKPSPNSQIKSVSGGDGDEEIWDDDDTGDKNIKNDSPGCKTPEEKENGGDNWDDEDIYANDRKKNVEESVKKVVDDVVSTTEVTDESQKEIVDKEKSDGNNSSPDKKPKRKRSHSDSSSSSSSSSSSDDDDDDDDEKNNGKDNKEDDDGGAMVKGKIDDEKVESDDEVMKNDSTDKEKEQLKVDGDGNADDDDDDDNDENEEGNKKTKAINEMEVDNIEKTDDVAAINENNDEKTTEDGGGDVADKETNDKTSKIEEPTPVETIDLDVDPKDEPGSRQLHKTSSIFLRNLAPTITKSEVEVMCKRFNGFLRVAIADPLVERRWFRRGWVTFQRNVNIKEICWNLNNIRLRDCELGAIVNRDLSRRVRPINGITAHKQIVRSDIKLCAKIAFNLDTKSSLWQSVQSDIDGDKQENGGGGLALSETFGLKSNNPVLQNITDYLIEEASAEEDELLGLSGGENKDSDGELLERDPQLIGVLDKLILYLRIVHSVDFYNHCEYPYEDEMPNRCGIIHARGPAPQNKVTQTELQEYTRNFEGKMSSFLAKSQPIEEDELKKLGCKDTDAEVEKFIQANTQELAKDKWLCPLSGKKFKGPDFIRKHIFNKHGEKVDEVKKEVEYFNNYLKDPKRSQLPEHPGNSRKPAADMQQSGYRGGYHPPGYGMPYAGYAPPMVAPPRPRGAGGFGGRRGGAGGGGGGGGGGGDYRPIIHYRDLDAPREPDDFL